MLRVKQLQLRVGLGLTLLGCCAQAHAVVINVPGDYSTIQDAIDAASNGDVVEIEDDVYTGAGNVNILLNKEIIVRSVSNDPISCVIDCDGAGRGFLVSGGTDLSATLIKGLTIKNGVATNGAGVYFSTSGTIDNCYVEGGMATVNGGGIVVDVEAHVWVVNCIIRLNSAGQMGGGLWSKAGDEEILTEVRSSAITENEAGWRGGGVHCFGPGGPAHLALIQCDIDDNTVGPDDSAVPLGGGVYNAYGFLEMVNCRVRGNQLDFSEGGLFDAAGAGIGTFDTGAFGRLDMVNCLVANNGTTDEDGVVKGGGIDNWGMEMHLVNCTIANNQATTAAGGINDRAGGANDSTIENTIIWGNETDASSEQIQLVAGDVEFRNCDIEGGLAGIGGSSEPSVFDDCFDQDPLFANSAGGNYLIEYFSPCVNNGDPALLPDDDFDIDGDVNTGETIPFDLRSHDRQVNPSTCVDVGAYEDQTEGTCPPDITGSGGVPDGNIDLDDLLLVLNSWGTPGGIVDIAGGTCGDGDVNMDDLLAIINNWGTCEGSEELPGKVASCMSECEEEPTPEDYAACLSRCLQE